MQARYISTTTTKYQSLTGRFNSTRQADRRLAPLANPAISMPGRLTSAWDCYPAHSLEQERIERPSTVSHQAHLRVVSHAKRTKRPNPSFFRE